MPLPRPARRRRQDSGFGQWVGDDWRTIADVAAFAACFVSLGICTLAAAVVITAKALADLKTHGLDYAGEQFAGNIRYGALGLAGGAAFGAAGGCLYVFRQGASVGFRVVRAC